LEVTHEETNQVKDYRLINLAREYELFKMESNKSIHEMHMRFITFVSELLSLGKKITNEEIVGKTLRSLPRAWNQESMANEEAKNLKMLNFNEFVRSLLSHEEKIKEFDVKNSSTKKKSLALKVINDNEDKN